MNPTELNAQIEKSVNKLDAIIGRANSRSGWVNYNQNLEIAFQEIDRLVSIFEEFFKGASMHDFQLKDSVQDQESVINLIDGFQKYIKDINQNNVFEKLRQDFRDLDAEVRAEYKKREDYWGTNSIAGQLSDKFFIPLAANSVIFSQLAGIFNLVISSAPASGTISSIAAGTLISNIVAGVGAVPTGILASCCMLWKEYSGRFPYEKMSPSEKIMRRVGMGLTILATIAVTSSLVAGFCVASPYLAIPMMVGGALIGLGSMLYSMSLYNYSHNRDASDKMIRDIKDSLKQLSNVPNKTTHIFSGKKPLEEPLLSPEKNHLPQVVNKWVNSVG